MKNKIIKDTYIPFKSGREIPPEIIRILTSKTTALPETIGSDDRLEGIEAQITDIQIALVELFEGSVSSD